MNFLNDLCEEIWFLNDRNEAIKTLELHAVDIDEYHSFLLEELIFGHREVTDDTQGSHYIVD